MNDIYLKSPQIKKKNDEFNLFLSKIIKNGDFNKLYNKNITQIYEIPIVVHVVSDGSPIGSDNNRSDAEIINWVNHANEIFAGNSAPVLSTSPINPTVSLTPTCTPSTITAPGNYSFGITSVKFGNINNDSKEYDQSTNNFYENFTNGYCLGKTVTNIPLASPTIITIKPGSQPNVSHLIRAYIDYDNNGQFNETTERVINQVISPGATLTMPITPPTNAVLNTPLRLRIIGESNNFASTVTACSNPTRGQVEDYAVIINSTTLSTYEANKENNIIISKLNSSIYIKSGKKIASVAVYDASGRKILSDNTIGSTEFTSTALETKDIIVFVNVTLEDGEIITKKIKL